MFFDFWAPFHTALQLIVPKLKAALRLEVFSKDGISLAWLYEFIIPECMKKFNCFSDSDSPGLQGHKSVFLNLFKESKS